jgi:hypothetical protein
MKKKVNYFSFVCLSGVIFSGSVDLYATMGRKSSSEEPFRVDIMTGIKYREVPGVGEDGKKVIYVVQIYPDGTSFCWKKTCACARTVFSLEVTNSEWIFDVMAAILAKNPKRLKILLGQCRNPRVLIGQRPTLLSDVRMKLEEARARCPKTSSRNGMRRSSSLPNLLNYNENFRTALREINALQEIIRLLLEFGYPDGGN